MRSANDRPLRPRALRFETCEDRIVLSGRPEADFYLDESLLDQPDDAFEQIAIETALADVHADYGVTYARSAFGLEGLGQTVVVIDSGIAYDHHALGGGLGYDYRVVGGWDFTEENDADPYDDGPAGFHGTHVAGIVGSDDPTYTGVAPGVDLVGLRVFNDQGAGYFEWVEQALGWVHTHRNDFAHPITTVTLSLGANWNADGIPTWAMLEDELAALNRDGIFIAVAAGNDFLDYGVPGLTYPAASPHVVPVASVSNDGTLSSFSQRSDRVLVAPGEQITSTVPDYLYSFDGVPNDFATASGTSMATPYVAGASVLIREAMQFAGHGDVTQDTIYELLRDTADLLYDAQTGQSYHQIDLQAALNAIMPADDYGSTSATAHALGTLSTDLTVAGSIGRLDDVDYFRFTAGATGVATFTMGSSPGFAADVELIGGSTQADDTNLTFDVVAGQQYTIGVGTVQGIGHYDMRLAVTSQIADLGVVDVVEFTEPGSGNGQYQFTAARDALLTVEVSFEHESRDTAVRLYDGHGNLIAEGSPSGSTARLGFTARAGEAYLLSVTGAEGAARYRLTNVFQDTSEVLDTTLGDFNGDGLTDVLGRTSTGDWWLARGTDSGFVTEYAGQWSTQENWREVVVDDLTGDGLSDVLGRTSTGDWWLARGTDSGFVTEYAGHWSTAADWDEVVIDDLTGDGLTDVLGRTDSGTWWVAVNTGSGFEAQYAGRWSPSVNWQQVIISDFTGDGLDDVLARSEAGNWWLATNRGSGFRNEKWGRWSETTAWSEVMAGDFTGDGLTDVIGRSGSGRWYLAKNTGGGSTNQLWGAWSANTKWSDVMVGDFSGDGRLDVVGRTSAGRWYVAQNTGGRFVTRVWGAWSPNADWSDVMAGDFTGDGRLDIIGRTGAGRWYVSQNTGHRFINRAWGMWSAATSWSNVSVGDFTGDGLQDITGQTASGSRWVSENTGSRFVNRLWKEWDAPTAASDDVESDIAQAILLQAASLKDDLDGWLSRREANDLAVSLMRTSGTSPNWADASDKFFAGPT